VSQLQISWQLSKFRHKQRWWWWWWWWWWHDERGGAAAWNANESIDYGLPASHAV